jgi:hypothetical protein
VLPELEENNMRHFIHLITISISLLAMSLPAAAQSRPAVDVVIAMDVSGSMSGLIDSAKQRLWDVVNTFGRAQPQPELRVAIVSYGNPNYGIDSGYVRIDQPLTTDLDRVNETLFAFTTNGGSEYVARAIATSIDELDWSQSADAMRVIFVAGNESAEQDPAFTLEDVLARAVENGIIVNAIYCGPENDSIASSWRQLASHTQGSFAAIDQSANVVAQIETPVDARLAELSAKLNETYIPYGDEGTQRKERQAQQDRNAQEMSISALASRVITKASALYQSVQWDLVDALEQGKPLSEIESEKLPEKMRNMPLDEIAQVVKAQSQRRDELKKEIADLDVQRRAYVEEYRSTNGAEGLGAALSDALTRQAEEHGFVVN